MASARKRKDCFTSFLFVLPLLALFLVFFAYPIIYNIVISFYDWNGISVEKVFVGFANYKKLWADSCNAENISKLCHYCNIYYGYSVSTWTYAGILFYQKDKVFRVL